MKIFSATVFLLFLMSSCEKKEGPVVVSSDYDFAMNRILDESLKSCDEEITFWKSRLIANADDQISIVKLAGLHSARFQLKGDIEDIKKSDSLYFILLDTYHSNDSEIFQSLAANCITQHEFRKAKKYLQKAWESGSNKTGTLLMLTDVNLELGNYPDAMSSISKVENKNAYACLIRQAKINDHEGDLDGAILLMEKALKRIEGSKSLYIWTLSNLADMYGHAGRVNDAYQAYLTVLKLNPDYDYALKGIAWIAFSHDKNTVEAKRIGRFLLQKKNLPDMHLLLSEIAQYEGNLPEHDAHMMQFVSEAVKPCYGKMYNRYLSLLEAEEMGNPAEAIEIAQKEIDNRPTPQSYDLLAWGYYHLGDKEKALAIAQNHVEGKTYEPDAAYHLGMIYKATDRKKSKELLSEALRSSFELGPGIKSIIQQELQSE